MSSFVSPCLDILLFALLPWLVWRGVRRSVPLAILPILIGMLLKASGLSLAGFPSVAGDELGWAGVLLLAMIAGMETRNPLAAAQSGFTSQLRGIARIAGSASLALLLPLGVGSVIAWNYFLNLPGWAPTSGNRPLAALALGLCIAVSALPVLVSIVRELPLAQRSLGQIALVVAILDDAALWIGLAILQFAAGGEAAFGHWGARQFVALIVLAAMPFAGGLANRRLAPPAAWHIWPVAVAYLLAGTWASSQLGLHPLIGAFIAGAALPARWVSRLPVEKIGVVALLGLAPFFFGHSGFRVAGGALNLVCFEAALALLVISVVTKLSAIMLFPPVAGMSRRNAMATGLLLQCKGLMEIVAAAILHQKGLISSDAYAALMILAVVSTTITLPLFRLSLNKARREALVDQSA